MISNLVEAGNIGKTIMFASKSIRTNENLLAERGPSIGGAGYLYGDPPAKRAKSIPHRHRELLATCTAQSAGHVLVDLGGVDGVSSTPPCPDV